MKLKEAIILFVLLLLGGCVTSVTRFAPGERSSICVGIGNCTEIYSNPEIPQCRQGEKGCGI